LDAPVSDLAVLLVCSSERDKIDEMVKEEIPPGCLVGLVGGLFTDKLGATALLLKARQYGDEHVKYGQT